MAFKKVSAPSGTFRSEGCVDPAFILKTGRNNSVLNRAFVTKLGFKAFDIVKFDTFIDNDDPQNIKIGIKVDEDGEWAKKVTKSLQIQIWFSSFLERNGIKLKNDEKNKSLKTICKLKYSEKLKMWIFTIPNEMISDGTEQKAVTVAKEGKKDKNKKKRKILTK